MKFSWSNFLSATLILFMPIFLYGEHNICNVENKTKIYKNKILPAEAYYAAALKGELAKSDNNKKAFLSSMQLVSAKSHGVSRGGIYKDFNNDIWIVKEGQNPVDEYLGSKVMNLLIGPCSPEVILLVDVPGYTASKLLLNFLTKFDIDVDPHYKPIIGEANLKAAMNLMGLQDRTNSNMGYIEMNDRLEAARVDFDYSFQFTETDNIIEDTVDSKMLAAIEAIYAIPDEMFLYVLGEAYNNLWASGIPFDYEKYKNLGPTLIARKHGLMGSGKKLIKSVIDNDLNAVRLLLKEGTDIIAVRDLLNNTLFDLAFQNDYIEMVNLLLEHGSDSKAQRAQALVAASRTGYIDIVKLLLKQGVDPNVQNSEAFLNASRNGHINIVKLLIEQGVDSKVQNAEALVGASRNGHIEIVKLLLKAGVDPKAQDSEALVGASYNGHIKIVEMLLKAGADAKAQDSKALVGASRGGYIEIAKLLLKKGADAKAQDSKALVYASRDGHIEIVKLLLKKDVDPKAQDSKALVYASRDGRIEIVKLLINKGSDAKAQDSTALLFASSNGHLEIVKLLLENGADPKAQDSKALVYASGYGHVEVVKQLLEKGADPKVQDSKALTYAFRNGHIEIIKLLLENGVNFKT